MVAKGWIRLSFLPHGAPVLFARKKTGELLLCIDFGALNANTRLDVFPLPRISYLLDRLGRARYFSSIDLLGAYY